MQKIIDKMRGWLTCLVVMSLMVMTPFQEPEIALASDYVEELQWSQMETQLLDGNTLEWHLENNDVNKSLEGQALAMTDQAEGLVSETLWSTAEDPVMNVTVDVPVTGEEIPMAGNDGFTEDEQEIRQKKDVPLPQWRISITNEQLDLLERCVMAEGGGESYDCQVAIACVIINRVLNENYPNTVEGVIKQKGQFSTWPTMIDTATPSNEVKQAVREALTSEVIPENVLYFRAGRYHRWGTRYCRMDHTYFSTP